jgi:glucose/arabinose dehydrogenase/uncharacterized cupredoxin-like copper-binding protein
MDSQLKPDACPDFVPTETPLHRVLWQRRKVFSWLALVLASVLFGWFAIPPVFSSALYQPNTVAVSLVDGAIQMPDSLLAGPTSFVVTNNGGMEHNFAIEGQGIEQVFETNLPPGEIRTMEIDLPVGEYRVYCPVADHAQQGMELTLTVTEAAAAPAQTPAATEEPAEEPTAAATEEPAEEPTAAATEEPAEEPTAAATEEAAEEPTPEATEEPSEEAATTGQALTVTSQLPGNPAIQLVKVADGLADPVNVAAPADGSGRLFVVERVGRIRIVQDGELLEQPFLDIKEIVKWDYLEQGLLGLAFHPDYAANGRFFVYYTDWRTNGDSFLVEYHVSDDPNVADPESGRVLLTHDQPYVNHNGGTIHFGPDGYLYVTLGDGGLAGDPYRNAQDLNTLLGKILRIDVNTQGARAYGIPDDNPFVRQVIESPVAEEAAQDGSYLPDARPEIWAYGLRNAWQFSFDAATGDLFIADVGQNLWEEVNFQPAGSAGGADYGWPIMEGAHCYPEDSQCGTAGVLPVAEYGHAEESCSITGIGVYRGGISTSLDGIYFNADYCSGKFWGLVHDAAGAWAYAELLDTELQISGAGADEAGELYVTACTCEYERGYDPDAEPGGSVWRLVAADQVPEGGETAPLQGATSAEEETAATGAGQVVQVSLVDGAIEMPNTLPAGPVTFEVTNTGAMEHNFEVEGGDIEEVFAENLAPGESQTMAIELPAGEYRVYCPVADHAQQGMELTLTVN